VKVVLDNGYLQQQELIRVLEAKLTAKLGAKYAKSASSGG